MQCLDEIMNKRMADKGGIWHGFASRYEPVLSRWRNDPINLLEIGVQFGNSCLGWLDYFTNATIVGIDIVKAHNISHERFRFYAGNQSDVAFLRQIQRESGPFRVIIDDASHRASDAKVSFETLWPGLQAGGMYAIEDVCTYWDREFSSPTNGVGWLSFLMSELNWWGKNYHGKPHPGKYTLSNLESTIDSMHLSKHLCILIKK